MKAIVTVSIFALSVATASACDFQRTAQSTTDKTVVASISTDSATQMSIPAQPVQPTEKAEATKAVAIEND